MQTAGEFINSTVSKLLLDLHKNSDFGEGKKRGKI